MVHAASLAALLFLVPAPLDRAPGLQGPGLKIEASLTEKGNFLIVHLPDEYAEEGEVVSFSVKRTFGLMPIGEAEADAEGVVRFAIPRKIRKDIDGGVTFVAVYEVPDEDKSLEAEIRLNVGADRPPVEWTLPPRELWSSRPPLSLVITIVVLYGAVWLSYIFTLSLLVRIKREGRKEGA